ncbi:MAG: sialate O-acetylesterase [Lentisphaerae bacterium]|nr:sialate O-acetylesterase [Lentisphaerota bacterium]
MVTYWVTMLAGATMAAVPSGFFAPHMMLQRERPIPVWGIAGPGEKVEVSFAGSRASAVADSAGNWSVDLPAMEASSEGRELKIGDRAIGDVIIGDVYLCSGQSNMQFPLCGKSASQHDMKGNALVQIANDPSIRFTSPRRAYCDALTNDVELIWGRASRADLERCRYEGNHEEGSISAIGYYFAKYVREAAQVPVGFIDVSRGGAFIEPNMPPNEVKRGKELALGAFGGHQKPGVMWNAMIAPMTRFPFKGVLWYQGESNKKDTNGVYLAKFTALVKGWRREFGNPKLPFYYVQMAPCSAGHLSVQLQQAEYEKTDPDAEMVVINDIGNLKNIHPRDKDTVGLRLALKALRRDYGFSDIEASSPVCVRAEKLADDRVVLTFDHAEWLYVLNEDTSLAADFELQGPDGRWQKAMIDNFKEVWLWYAKCNVKNGTFKDNQIELSVAGLGEPRRVRYLYNSPWQGSVFNQASLPLSAFEREVR